LFLPLALVFVVPEFILFDDFEGELLRSARTHSFHEIKRTKSDIVENDKVQNSKCSNCQSSWKNDGDKNSYVEGSVQYNMGHVDGGTYSTHSYGWKF
jgi:hypothetical protein